MGQRKYSFKKAVKRCIKAFQTHKMIKVSPEGFISLINEEETDTKALKNGEENCEELSD